MRTVIIVQARMTSTRLPGKVLKRVLDKPLLQYQIERLNRVSLADEVVIATTNTGDEQPIVALCQELGTPFFRGSEDDVLARYYHTAVQHQAEIVVRVTSDCPLIDPAVIDQVLRFYLDNSYYHYVSNALKRTYPRGMDTEVFPMTALTLAYHEATAPADREHVTPFLQRQPERFQIGHVLYAENQSRHRWTVDTAEDFQLIENILTALVPAKPEFTLRDCLELLEKHPEWHKINAHIEQKKYGE